MEAFLGGTGRGQVLAALGYTAVDPTGASGVSMLSASQTDSRVPVNNQQISSTSRAFWKYLYCTKTAFVDTRG